MRSLLAFAALVLLVAPGCGDDTSAPPSDLSTIVDMSIGADMQQLTCKQALACSQACTTLACAATCLAEANPTAKQNLGKLASCLVGVCGPVDGGSGMCTSPADNSAACQGCEANAVATGPCMTAYATCQSS